MNGFGYQLHNTTNSDISKVTIESPSYAPKSQYMPGETEAGQSHPTILLFDNMAIFDNKEEMYKIYNKFLQWKKEPLKPEFMKKIEAQRVHPFIRLCHLLHLPPPTSRYYGARKKNAHRS